MTEFTMDDLRRILRACAGEATPGILDTDIVDVPFRDLGYDSLAQLELASQIGREYATSIPDDAAVALETPRAAIAYVNDRIAARV
ncbi:MAG TPA: acyl carrier protein [Rugosimonospora sp.]|nr:acyl carrier protein [Rugosimonospora sp.]